MSQKRKKLVIAVFIIIGLLAVINIPIWIIQAVKDVPDNWWVYIASAIVDCVLVVGLIIVMWAVMPGILREERATALKEIDFDILGASETPQTTFSSYHPLIPQVTFNEKALCYETFELDANFAPILKAESINKKKRQLTFEDFITKKIDVDYAVLKFSVCTNRMNWKSVPQIGIAIKLPAEAGIISENEIIVKANTDLLTQILGHSLTIKNMELLQSKPLEIKPTVIKKFAFPKIKMSVKLIIVAVTIVASVIVTITIKNSSFVAFTGAMICSMIIIQQSPTLVIYDKYIGNGFNLFSISEVENVREKINASNAKNSYVEIISPGFYLVYQHSEGLVNALKSALPNATFETEQIS